MASDDEDHPARRRLCAGCVGEPFLKAIIRREGKVASCAFCSRRRGPCFTLEQMADRVQTAFAEHYVRTADQPDEDESLAQRYGDYEWTRRGMAANEAIQLAAQIEPEPGDAIAEILEDRYNTLSPGDPIEEQEFDGESHYERRRSAEDDHFHQDWDRFEQSLKSEARFFSRKAQAVLSNIFDGIADARTKAGEPVIFTAGPGTPLTTLFRARVFQSRDRLVAALERPDLEVAPPPSVFAKAGRMNARGVPVFYGATDERIAMAEVRPPVGADVIVARFDLARSVRLLDVAGLGRVFVEGSIFDPTLAAQQKRALFLQTLSTRITRPVMPDAEDFEYLVTQAMADYLADHPSLDLDGILFKSVQSRTKGSNVVLFHKASRAALFDLPPGSAVRANYYAGHWEEDPDDTPPMWTVREVIPVPRTNTDASRDPLSSIADHFASGWFDEEADPRPISLRLDPASLVVHHVSGVRFTTHTTPVKRTRHKKADAKVVEPDDDEPF